MRKPLILLAIALATAACSQQPGNTYTLDGTVGETTADSIYIFDPSGRGQLAAAPIVNGAFHFEGTVDSVRSIVLVVGNRPILGAYLEPGKMQAQLPDNQYITGTPLNDEDAALTRHFDDLQKRAEAGEDIDLMAETQKAVGDLLSRHKNDALGYYYFTNFAGECFTFDEAEAFLADAGPILTESETVRKIVNHLRIRQATEVGKPYIDIAGADARKPEATLKLSDILAEGKPVLVDFWASWCGPCRREIPHIKACAEKYATDVNVVGIAVWDEMPATQQAMQELGITWPVIFNEREATDAYGVSGIPHILLIAPDGTILARDLRGEAIGKAIDKALGK